MKCGEPISLLGLLDRETRYKQFACSKCLTVYLQNTNGLIFPKDEIRRLPTHEIFEEEV